MAKGLYSIIGSVTKKIKKIYCVISGQTRKIKKIYTVVNGVTKLTWSGVTPVYFLSNMNVNNRVNNIVQCDDGSTVINTISSFLSTGHSIYGAPTDLYQFAVGKFTYAFGKYFGVFSQTNSTYNFFGTSTDGNTWTTSRKDDYYYLNTWCLKTPDGDIVHRVYEEYNESEDLTDVKYQYTINGTQWVTLSTNNKGMFLYNNGIHYKILGGRLEKLNVFNGTRVSYITFPQCAFYMTKNNLIFGITSNTSTTTRLYYSNGTDAYTLVTTPVALGNQTLARPFIAYKNGMYVVGGFNTATTYRPFWSGSAIAYSTDLVNWTKVGSFGGNFRFVAANEEYFFFGSTSTTLISSDGITWTEASTVFPNFTNVSMYIFGENEY